MAEPEPEEEAGTRIVMYLTFLRFTMRRPEAEYRTPGTLGGGTKGAGGAEDGPATAPESVSVDETEEEEGGGEGERRRLRGRGTAAAALHGLHLQRRRPWSQNRCGEHFLH